MSRLVLVLTMVLFLAIDTTRAGCWLKRWRSLRCERPACVVVESSCCTTVPACGPPACGTTISACPPVDCCASSDSLSVDCCSSDQVVVDSGSVSGSEHAPTPAGHEPVEADDDTNAEDALEVPDEEEMDDDDMSVDTVDESAEADDDDDASASPNDIFSADAADDDDAVAEPATDDDADAFSPAEDATNTDDLFDDSSAEAADTTTDATDDLFNDTPADDDAAADADLFDDTPATTDDAADDLFSDPPADDDADAAVDIFEGADADTPADDATRVADNVDDLFNDADAAPATDDADAGLDDLFDDVEDAADDADNSLDNLFDDSSSLPSKSLFRTAKVSSRNADQPTNRLWTDNTGNFQTLGRLVEVRDTEIRIFKDNGRFSTVPKTRLSPIDLKYVTKMADRLNQSTIEISVKH